MRSIAGALIILIFGQFLIKEAQAESMKPPIEKATFAGGCFWGMEKLFGEITGVVSTRVGYTGGAVKDPGYEMVCTGSTGHAEAIEITFDPLKISYARLLAVFFSTHDPTTPNRQGNDKGTQYRSAIYYHDASQERLAGQAIERLTKSKAFRDRIVTQVEPAGEFYPAEDYHQEYLKKNPDGYCAVHYQSQKVSEILIDLDRHA